MGKKEDVIANQSADWFVMTFLLFGRFVFLRQPHGSFLGCVSQFPHDFNKLIQRIRPINSKLPVFEHHEIPIIVPALCLPLAA